MIANLDALQAGTAAPIYQLKVVLVGSEPPIWRRLQVPGNANLGWLHAVLQIAMGWTNSHLHHFVTRDARYSDPRHDEDSISDIERDRDEWRARLSQVAGAKGAQFEYEYDFGDSWLHEVMVEKILPPGSGSAPAALCLNGARACPPEDCGGIWGYEELLKILRNPKHPEYRDKKEWIGDAMIDPNAFDKAKINFWLSKLKWPRVTEAQLRKVLLGRNNYLEG